MIKQPFIEEEFIYKIPREEWTTEQNKAYFRKLAERIPQCIEGKFFCYESILDYQFKRNSSAWTSYRWEYNKWATSEIEKFWIRGKGATDITKIPNPFFAEEYILPYLIINYIEKNPIDKTKLAILKKNTDNINKAEFHITKSYNKYQVYKNQYGFWSLIENFSTKKEANQFIEIQQKKLNTDMKKQTSKKNFIVEVKKRPDNQKWQQIDAMREKSQFDVSDYDNAGKMLVYHIKNDILGWRLYVKRTTETMKKFPDLEKTYSTVKKITIKKKNGLQGTNKKSIKNFTVNCEFIFKGYFEVVAERKQEAERKVYENTGCALSKIETSDSDVVDWNFATNADKRINSIKKIALNNFEVNCEFIFKGYFEVVAESKQEAVRKVYENTGCTLSKIETADSDVVDWDFAINADKKIKTNKKKSQGLQGTKNQTKKYTLHIIHGKKEIENWENKKPYIFEEKNFSSKQEAVDFIKSYIPKEKSEGIIVDGTDYSNPSLDGLNGYKWKPSKSQRKAFTEKMNNDAEFAKAYYDRKNKKAEKRRSTSQFDYSSAGGMFVPTKAQNDAAFEMVSKKLSIKQLQAANDVLFGYSNKEKVHHDSIHIVNEYIRSGGEYNDYNEGLQGTTVYMPAMPAWVNRLRDFIHKEKHIRSYNRHSKTIIALLRKIQDDFRKKIIKKADKGATLVDQIQHFLIQVIKQKKWNVEDAKNISAKAIELTKNYKTNPATKLIATALKNPTKATKNAKKLKGEYRYKSVISTVAHSGAVPLLSNKMEKRFNPVKKKS